jgi:hypothetical protein
VRALLQTLSKLIVLRVKQLFQLLRVQLFQIMLALLDQSYLILSSNLIDIHKGKREQELGYVIYGIAVFLILQQILYSVNGISMRKKEN